MQLVNSIELCSKLILSASPSPPLYSLFHPCHIGCETFRFAERELNANDYPANYHFHDGKDDGFCTPNFPLGEFQNAEAREQAEKVGGAPSREVIFTRALFFLGRLVRLEKNARNAKVKRLARGDI